MADTNGAAYQAPPGQGQGPPPAATQPTYTPPPSQQPPPQAPPQQTPPQGPIYPGQVTAPAPPPSSQPPPQQPPAWAQPPAPAQAPASALTVERLRQIGVQLPQGASEEQALTVLGEQLRQMAQLQQLAPYAQRYAQYGGQFEQYLQAVQQREQQQRAAQQNQPWWAPYWAPPEYDPAWERQVLVDQQGNMHPAPGASYDVVAKLQAYQQFQRQQVEKLVRNPYEFMQGGMEHVARHVAEQVMQQHLGQYQARQFANGFVADNASWLFAADQQGAPLVNPQTGGRQLSVLGERFAGYVQELERQGVADVQTQQRLALAQVQRDWSLYALAAQQQQQQQGQQGWLQGAQPAETGAWGQALVPQQQQAPPQGFQFNPQLAPQQAPDPRLRANQEFLARQQAQQQQGGNNRIAQQQGGQQQPPPWGGQPTGNHQGRIEDALRRNLMAAGFVAPTPQGGPFG